MDHGDGMDKGANGADTPHATTPKSSCVPSGTALAVAASGTAFDRVCLAAPAGQPFTIAFDNKDSLAHNVAILESHSSTKDLFRGDVFQGPKATTYSVPALKAGSYVFHCEVHPAAMNGTFIVS